MPKRDFVILDQDLKAKFPLAPRHVVRDNFEWILAFVLMVAGFVFINFPQDPLKAYPTLFTNVKDPLLGLMIGAFLVLMLKIGYSVLSYKYLSYELSGDQLTLSRGVLLKKKQILFIGKIVDVYLKRSILDVVFGLNSVGLVVLGQADILLSGFNNRVASRFQQHLVALIEENENKAHRTDIADVEVETMPVHAIRPLKGHTPSLHRKPASA